MVHAFVGVTCLEHAHVVHAFVGAARVTHARACVVHAFVSTARVVHACVIYAFVGAACVVHACVVLHTPGYSDLDLSLAESLDSWPGSRAVLQTTYATCLQSMTLSSLPVPLSTLCQRS